MPQRSRAGAARLAQLTARTSLNPRLPDPIRGPRMLARRNGPVVCALVICCAEGALATATTTRPAETTPDRPTPLVSRHVELHYRSENLTPDTRIELWYTRDRGATWQYGGADEDARSPMIFQAPADGLYGVSLRLRDPEHPLRGPDRFEMPQRWLLVDATPPLVQWDSVDRSREADGWMLHLRWTAFDDHFGPRPITLACQPEGTTDWVPIASELANLGRYEWAVPPDLCGRLMLRIRACDAAGNCVKRTFGPVAVEAASREIAAGPATRPVAAPSPSTRPASAVPSPAAVEARRRADELYEQGAWHLQRGQYAVAAERFREALEAHPDHLAARNDLAGIFYLQRDYPRALELYQAVLQRDANHPAALRGAALAHVALKQYAASREALQRLLAINSNDAEAWLDLGDVLFMMGQQREARAHWSRAAGIDAAAETIIQKARRRLELYAAEP